MLWRRSELLHLVEGVRREFPWVGPVAFIEPLVSITWLYDTIVACAGYDTGCCTSHSIPLVEMFMMFPMKFSKLKDDWQDIIDNACIEMSAGLGCAITELDQIVREREADGSPNGKYEDHTAEKIDCLLRFIDDLLERSTCDALLKIYQTTLEDLWLHDADENNSRVNTMNAIKQKLAPHLTIARRKIQQRFPVQGDAAVYKKCPKCGEVYMRPTGCDYLGTCGKKAGFKQDAGHNGRMKVPFLYEYHLEQNGAARVQVLESEGREPGDLEEKSWQWRRVLNNLRETLRIDEGESRSTHWDDTKGEVPIGCGEQLAWSTMPSVPREDLVTLGLLSPSTKVAHAVARDNRTMAIESFLRDKCGNAYVPYLDAFKEQGLRTVGDVIDCVSESELRGVLPALGITNTLHQNVIMKAFEQFRL